MKNNNLKHLKNQRFCRCGQIIPRDEAIFLCAKVCENCRTETFAPAVPAAIIPGHHRKIKLEPCPVCLFAFGENKMHGTMCAGCSLKNETLPKVPPRILITATLRNFLSGYAAVGGAR